MSLYHYRRRINALERKLAIPLAVVRMRPIAQKYCEQWEIAVAEGNEPPPATHAEAMDSENKTAKSLIELIAEAGFRLSTWMSLAHHIQRCRQQREYPHYNDILRYLLPKAAVMGFIPKSPPPVSY